MSTETGFTENNLINDSDAYRDALSQLATVLATLPAQTVFDVIEQDAGMILLSNLNDTLAQEHPEFYAKLAKLSG